MSVATGDRNVEARIEALRRELAGLIVTLSNAGQRLEDLADELRSRRQADKVVALDQQRRRKNRHHADILIDFLE